MIHIDSLLLEAFYKENKDFFENARVQKIQQPTRKEIILQLRKNTEHGGETRKLYININPGFYHLCFMSKENELRRNIEIPNQPPMFCMLLRKHMEGARILKINQPPFERILELTFENYNEIGDRIQECLSIELMGKHSNIVLYNTDNNIIIGCAHNIGEEKSKERELAGGLPYIYPPKQDKKNLLQTRFAWFESAILKSSDTLKKTISSRYFSLSQALVEEICIKKNIDSDAVANTFSKEDLQILFIELHEFLQRENYSFTLSKNHERYSCINALDKTYNSINALIDDYFAYHIEKNLVSNLKTNLKLKINKELKKLKNTYDNQQKQLEKNDKLQMYKTKGNLLTANAYQIKNGENSVLLKDFETDKMIEIQLEETKSVIENAQKFFALYNKGKRACQIAQEMSEKTLEEINYCKQLLYDIETCESFYELKDIAAEIAPEETVKTKKKEAKKKEESVNITKFEIDDCIVYVGKNNKQNDYLYSKISSPNDLWFHTLNTPGSHVILKTKDTSGNISNETILKAAKLAKEYSTAKNSTKVSVIYTLRKYIKRPNNTKSGFVVYKNETEIVTE